MLRCFALLNLFIAITLKRITFKTWNLRIWTEMPEDGDRMFSWNVLVKEKVFPYHISTLDPFRKKNPKRKEKKNLGQKICLVEFVKSFYSSIHSFIHLISHWFFFLIKVCCTKSLRSILSLLLLNLVLKETVLQKELSYKKALPRGKLNEKKLCKKCIYIICGLLGITKTDEEWQKDFRGLGKPARTIRTTKWSPCLLNN